MKKKILFLSVIIFAIILFLLLGATNVNAATSNDGMWKYDFINPEYPYEGIILTEYLGGKKNILEIPEFIHSQDNNGGYAINGFSNTFNWNGNKPNNLYFNAFTLKNIYDRYGTFTINPWADYNYVIGYFYDDNVTWQREIAKKFYDTVGKTTILTDKLSNPLYNIYKVYDGNKKSISIIDKIDNVYFQDISDYAFEGTNFEEINLPNTMLGLWTGAFKNCKKLKKINIPSEETQIVDSLFEGCSSLTDIVLPNDIQWIGTNAFKGCSSLNTITIPKKTTEMDDKIFDTNTNVTIICAPHTMAMKYAIDNNIKHSLTSKINISTDKHIDDYSYISDKKYTGNGRKIDIYFYYYYKIKGASGNTYYYSNPLEEGKDYKVTYSNNVNIGTATVTITGIGDFTGTITKKFKIIPNKIEIKSAKNSSKKAIKVKWNKDKNVKGYEVYVSERVVDKNYMLVNAKELSLRAKPTTKSEEYCILGKGQKVRIIKKNVKIANGYTWYKISVEGEGEYAEGYVASEYLTTAYKAKKYKNVKTITKNNTTSYTIKKLTKGKTYYVKVRSYKTVNGKKYYSNYSTVKTVKIKK